jgi:hypothetical protein
MHDIGLETAEPFNKMVFYIIFLFLSLLLSSQVHSLLPLG